MTQTSILTPHHRTVIAVSNDVSRYGYVTPYIIVDTPAITDYRICQLPPGSSLADQIAVLNTQVGTSVLIQPDPLAGVNRILAANNSDTSTTRCNGCQSALTALDWGLGCLYPFCRFRLSSRLIYLMSSHGLSVPDMTPEVCRLFVERDQWFMDLSMLFDSTFHHYYPHTVLDDTHRQSLYISIAHFKRQLKCSTSPFNTYHFLMAKLLESLSLPGFTANIISKLVAHSVCTKEEFFPLVTQALEQPSMLEAMGISQHDAFCTARGAHYYTNELATIHEHLFSGFDSFDNQSKSARSRGNYNLFDIVVDTPN